jgi:ceramide glucosyltransferase
LPPVSILKPVRGLDPRFEDNLRAHLQQDYPDFEILVGAADASDPGLEAASRVALEYPHRRLETVACGSGEEGNRKVAILERLAPHARHELLLVDDADIRPSQGWLGSTVAALQQADAGLATCLYRARPGATLGSKIDALWVSAGFPGQAVTASELGGMSFALGAAMLFRREDLERIGGFSAIRPFLADDYQLGVRIAALGRPTILSPSVVETVAGDVSLAETCRRHLRWARTIRVSRPAGYFGLAFTFGSVWSLALLLSAGTASPWAWIAGVCLAARCAAAATVARTVGAHLGRAWFLLPAADLGSFGVWLAGCFGSTVMWRDHELRLDREGRILPPRGPQ